MAVILNIGFSRYLLPDNVNVNLLIKSLSKAKELDGNFNSDTAKYFYSIRENKVEIQITIVSDADIIPAEKRKNIPPQPGLLFHAKDITTP